MIELRVLGPIEAYRGGEPVPLGSRKQRSVLAVLAANAGHLVPTDRIIESVWGDGASPDAKRSVQTYVSNLRSALDPNRTGLIHGSADGYTLSLDGISLDWFEFERLAVSSDLDHLEAALGLWRGAPFEDVEQEWAQARVVAWEELRLGAIERWATGLSAAGRASEALPVLEQTVAEYPLRETLWAGLMSALVAAGRHADALSAYQRLRQRLIEDMGIDPSPEIRALEEQILLEDPSLKPLAVGPAVRSRLPSERVRLIGRDDALADLLGLLSENRLLTLHGPGGSGKTTLAVAVARQSDREASFVDLSSTADPGAVAKAVADALGVVVDASDEGALLELLVRIVGERKVLVVLDNCEHVIEDAAEVADALLNGSPGISVLATSREALGIRGEIIYEVLPLSTDGGVDASPALSLLLERAKAANRLFDPSVDEVALLNGVCVALEGMPLAIELAAAQLGFLDPAELASSLGDRLGMASGRRGSARHETLLATMEWSWNLLSEAERRLLAEVSVFSGGWTLPAAQGICAGPPGEVRELLRALGAKSLVVVEPGRWGSRYRLLDTVRLFGAGRLDDSGSLRTKHAHWFSNWVDSWSPEDHWASGELASRLILDWENLRTAFAILRDTDPPAAVRLMSGFLGLWFFEHPGAEALEWTGAVDPTDLADDLKVQWLLCRGVAFQINRDFQTMWEFAGKAIDLARTSDRSDLLAVALAVSAFGYLLVDLDANENRWSEVREVAEAAGLERVTAAAWAMLAIGNDLRGGPIDLTREALERARGLVGASGWDHSIVFLGLLRLLLAEGRFAAAEVAAATRVQVAADFGLGLDVARCQLHQAYAAARAGSPETWSQALLAAHRHFRNAWGDRADSDVLLRIAAWEVFQGDPVRGSELLRVVRQAGLEYPDSYVQYTDIRDAARSLNLPKDDLARAWADAEAMALPDVMAREFQRLGW